MLCWQVNLIVMTRVLLKSYLIMLPTLKACITPLMALQLSRQWCLLRSGARVRQHNYMQVWLIYLSYLMLA